MKILTPIKAIRANCLECSAGQVREVELCPIKRCPLYPYRMGRRPRAEDFPGEVIETTQTIANRTLIQ